MQAVAVPADFGGLESLGPLTRATGHPSNRGGRALCVGANWVGVQWGLLGMLDTHQIGLSETRKPVHPV